MKRWLLVFLVLVLAGLAAASFLLTWGIQHYRKNLIQGLEQSLGHPVKLEQVGVNLLGGVNVSLRGFAVYSSREALDRPAVEVGSLDLSLRLAPLLRRRIEIGAIRIVHPKMALVKDSKGSVAIEGFPPAASGPAPAAASAHGMPSLPFSIGSLEIRQAEITLKDPSARPPLSLAIDQIDVTVANLSLTQPIDFKAQAAFLGPRQNLFLRGKLRLPAFGNPGSLEGLEMEAKALDLALLYPAAGPNDTALRGMLWFELAGRAPTLAGAEFSKALSGSGKLRLEGLTLVNLNLLREVLRQITVIPGIVGVLEGGLPSSYKEKLSKRDTLFEPIDIQASLKDGAISFDDFRLATDTLELTGRGTLGLDGRLNSSTTLHVEPELSEAIVGSVRELSALLEGGRFTLPVLISGTLPAVTVLPDLSYIASRVFTQKAGDVLGDLLDKVLKP